MLKRQNCCCYLSSGDLRGLRVRTGSGAGLLTACVLSLAVSACGWLDGDAASGSNSAISAAPSDVVNSNLIPNASAAPAKSGTTSTTITTTDESGTGTIKTGAARTAGVTSANWIDTLIDDMRLFHDAPSAVLEAIPGWGSGADWPEATPRPSDYAYATPWTHVMEDTSHPNGKGYPWRVPGPYTGNQAPNTRVQQRDLQMWWLLDDGRWVLGSHTAAPGGTTYPYLFIEGTHKDGTAIWRDESANGGGVSMRGLGREGYEGYLWHTWGGPNLIPMNAVGAAVAFFARLTLDNPNGPDDREKAHILAAGAGDWYKDQATISGWKAQGVNVLYMGFSRFKYVTSEWQLFGWTSLSETQIRANPPPFIGLPK